MPFPAGGGTDAFARPLAAQLEKQLNQRILVDNRGGAGGTIGASAAAKAEPNGYTFLVGAAHHTIAPWLYPKLDYDIEKDFIPIGVIAMPPQVIVVNPGKVEAKTLAEFIAYAKANPAKINYASAGMGTTHQLAGELFKLLTGTNLNHVPYRGAGPAMQDLVAGHVHAMFDGLGSSANQIQSGTLRGLAVAAPERSPAIPDVPTSRGGRAEGLRGLDLVRDLGAEGHAERHRRKDGGRNAQGARCRRDQGSVEEERLAHADADARGVRQVRHVGSRPLGQGGEGRRHQARDAVMRRSPDEAKQSSAEFARN